MKKVFVYGTLKRNQRLNYILRNSRLIRVDKIKGKLYVDNIDKLPIYIQGEGMVRGEIYDVENLSWELIRMMEEGAGYHILKIKTMSGINVIVFEGNRFWKDEIKREPKRFDLLEEY